jgi:hypothetical protein
MVLNWSCKTTKIEPPKPPNFSLIAASKINLYDWFANQYQYGRFIKVVE